MAAPEAASATVPSAEVVGNAFVEQYYHILHQSPGLVHRFYQDLSFLSRPDTNGHMTTVTTMREINNKILSLNYEDYTAEIKTADAQESYEKGVIVLVTGCLTGKDNVKRKFTQTFFLAPQDRGYFVLNDVFRFVEEDESLPSEPVVVNGTDEIAPLTASTPEPEPAQAVDNQTADPATFEEEDLNDDAEVCDPSDKDYESAVEEEVVEPQADSTQNEVLPGVDEAPPASEDAPKKSYASIVKVPKGSAPPRPAYVRAPNVKAVSSNSEQQPLDPIKPASAPEPLAPTGGNASENIDTRVEAEGYSIYVRNLPFTATPAQLDEAFKKFGPIKRNGIQVRSNKQGLCFGFVEFETLSSMQSALEASPINIGDHQAIVEEKRTTTRVGSSGRGRYSSGRGGFRSDSFKSRGNFGSSRGYGRNEFRNQGESSGRPRGSTGWNGEDYQRVNQNGSRRGGRQGAPKAGSGTT